MDAYFLEVIAGDLRFLHSEWDQEIDEDSLRISSPILRRLLVDMDLGKAWRMARHNGEPEINASSLKHIYHFAKKSRIDMKSVRLATAGGARYHGSILQGFFDIEFVLSDFHIDRIREMKPVNEILKLTPFTRSFCMIVNGTPVSRADLIKYVVNSLGGAHLGPPKRKKQLPTYRLLESIRKTHGVLGIDAVYYELLSIGQQLNQSEDIKMLLAEIDHSQI